MEIHSIFNYYCVNKPFLDIIMLAFKSVVWCVVLCCVVLCCVVLCCVVCVFTSY